MSGIAHITSIDRRVSGLISAGQCPVFEAVASNTKRNIEPVYFKFVQGRRIFNEIMASQLGAVLGLPVAQAYLCACPGMLLAGHDLPFSVESKEFYSGAASAKVFTIRYRGGESELVKLEDELLNWPHLPLAAVFDELILNDDRHFQNVLKVAQRKFVLIDHEQAFGGLGLPSNIGDKFVSPSEGNYLASLIFRSGHDLTIRRLFEAARNVSEKIQGLSGSDFPDLTPLIKIGLVDESDVDEMIGLVRVRAINLQKLVYHHDAVMQIFSTTSNKR